MLSGILSLSSAQRFADAVRYVRPDPFVAERGLLTGDFPGAEVILKSDPVHERLPKAALPSQHTYGKELAYPSHAYILTASARPGAALSILKMIRVLIRHAINIGWLKHDPSLGIKRPKIQRIRSWTEDEIESYRKRWPLGTKQRLAFELFLNTGQRRSDVVRMAWSHITADNKIVVVQQKTGRRLLIPLHSDLVTALAAAKRAHVSILTTMYSKPFTVDGFSQWMRNAITNAGLPLDCQPHGLRKATGRRLAEAGATAKMIMSILGHTTLAEAERYTEEADQAGLAEDAVIKLEGHRANRITQTASAGLGKTPKTKGKSR